MADMLLGNIRDDSGPTPPSKEADRKAALEQLIQRHGDIMLRTGITLEPVRGFATLYTAEGETPTSEMRINLTDRLQFLHYLQALQPETITDSQVLGLVTVAETLRQQLTGEYKLDDPSDDRMIELLGNLDSIIDSYDRLDPGGQRGLRASIERLREYAKIAQAKYLPEFIMVQKADLLAEIGGGNFGPSKWHTDSTPQYYRRRWERTLAVLERVKKNPNASELAARLLEHLVQSARYAHDDLEQKEATHIMTSNERKLLDVLEEMQDRLQLL